MKSGRLNLPVAWLITSMLSAIIAVGGYAWGKAGDCTPQQVDGQCGLSTFVGLVCGVGTGLVIFLISTVSFLVIAYRRRNASRHGPK
jgi:hypothetical protein